jgi:thiamine pyrophosphokinase
VLCAGGDADGVTITGAKYNIENADLTMDFPIGVSNEVKKGDTAQVSVEHGRLFIIKIVDE